MLVYLYVKLKMHRRRYLYGDYFLSKSYEWLEIEHVWKNNVKFSVILYRNVIYNTVSSIAEMWLTAYLETYTNEYKVVSVFSAYTSTFPRHRAIDTAYMVSVWFGWVMVR